uniref:Uncharacterized protein n=1 Tax=Meloidogyne hapla TaxID=6305 RepID=A0A1I8BKN7_MELHA
MKEESLGMKYLHKMWLFRRGYFYSKYDELFELNEEKLEKEGNLMIKIQFGFWKNLKEIKNKMDAFTFDDKWNKEWKEIEKGNYGELTEDFSEFLNEERKK